MFYARVRVDDLWMDKHVVIEICHKNNPGEEAVTDITCLSNKLDGSDGIMSWWRTDFNVGMTFEEAEEYLQTLDAFQEEDEVALDIESMIWKSNVNYVPEQMVIYDSVIYKVIQAHTSQDDWTPDVTPSLFAKALTKPNEVLPWEQPDSTNPYMKGDRVLFNGKTYESLIDNNVWSPEAYPAGWKEV